MNHSTAVKTPSYLKPILINRWAIQCLSAITIQQLIDASSMIWLVMTMEKLTSHQSFFLYLFLYLFTVIISYVPGCIALISRISWKQEAQRVFIYAFVDSNRGQVGEWGNHSSRDEKLSILTAEGPSALHTLIDYLYDFFWFVTSVLFSISTLSLIVEPLLGVVYIISILLVIGLMQIYRRRQQRLTQKALSARIDLSQSLLASWDNVLIGNTYNFNLWHERMNQRVNRCLYKNRDLERFDQILAITVSLMTSIPCLGVVAYSAYKNQHDPATLASFLITLPILTLVLYNTHQTLSLLFRWRMHKSKLRAIYRAIEPIKEIEGGLARKIQWEKLRFYLHTTEGDRGNIAHPIREPNDLIVHTHTPSRITVRGENGSGKSTLLMMIKQELEDKAFFFPTQNQLSFISKPNKYSTGESLKNRLVELYEKVNNIQVILLDEWDANLDGENREKLNSIIDQLVNKGYSVIEVRHH